MSDPILARLQALDDDHDDRPALSPLEIAALGASAVLATPGLSAEQKIDVITRIFKACKVQ